MKIHDYQVMTDEEYREYMQRLQAASAQPQYFDMSGETAKITINRNDEAYDEYMAGHGGCGVGIQQAAQPRPLRHGERFSLDKSKQRIIYEKEDGESGRLVFHIEDKDRATAE
jgi:hypothetical protein